MSVDGGNGDWNVVTKRKRRTKKRKVDDSPKDTEEEDLTVVPDARENKVTPSPPAVATPAQQDPAPVVEIEKRKPTKPPMRSSNPPLAASHQMLFNTEASPSTQQQVPKEEAVAQEPAKKPAEPLEQEDEFQPETQTSAGQNLPQSSSQKSRAEPMPKPKPAATNTAAELSSPVHANVAKAAPANGNSKKPANRQPAQKQQEPAPAPAQDGWNVVTRKSKRREAKRQFNGPQSPTPEAADEQDEFEENVPQNDGRSNEPSAEDKKQSGKKKKRKKKKAPAAAEIQDPEKAQDSAVSDCPLDQIKDILRTRGGVVTLNEICLDLDSRFQRTWKSSYKRKHGPLRQFLESNGFQVDSGSDSVTLSKSKAASPPQSKEAPPKRAPPPKPSPNSPVKRPPPGKTKPPASANSSLPETEESKPRAPAKKRKNKKRKGGGGHQQGAQGGGGRDSAKKSQPATLAGSWTNTVVLVAMGCAGVAAVWLGGGAGKLA